MFMQYHLQTAVSHPPLLAQPTWCVRVNSNQRTGWSRKFPPHTSPGPLRVFLLSPTGSIKCSWENPLCRLEDSPASTERQKLPLSSSSQLYISWWVQLWFLDRLIAPMALLLSEHSQPRCGDLVQQRWSSWCLPAQHCAHEHDVSNGQVFCFSLVEPWELPGIN